MSVLCIGTHRGAVLLHGVRHLVVFVLAALPGKEAGLAHVEVEALEASISEALYRGKTNFIFFGPVDLLPEV